MTHDFFFAEIQPIFWQWSTTVEVYSQFLFADVILCNIVVYTQSLTQMLQVVAGPMMQVLEEEIQSNKRTLSKLDKEKKELLSMLNDTV